MASDRAKPRLPVTYRSLFSLYHEPQFRVVFKISAYDVSNMVPPYLQNWQTEGPGAGHLFLVAETTLCSFISILLFYGNRSISWVQNSPPRTTFSCFPCSYMCLVQRSWPMGWQEGSTLFHLSLSHWLECKCDGRNRTCHFGPHNESCTLRKAEQQD